MKNSPYLDKPTRSEAEALVDRYRQHLAYDHRPLGDCGPSKQAAWENCLAHHEGRPVQKDLIC